MSDERERIGRCGWLALAVVFFLLPGLLAGSFYGGLAGLRSAEHFVHGAASDMISQILVLSGMIIGLLLWTIIVMVLTIAIVRKRRLAAAAWNFFKKDVSVFHRTLNQ